VDEGIVLNLQNCIFYIAGASEARNSFRTEAFCGWEFGRASCLAAGLACAAPQGLGKFVDPVFADITVKMGVLTENMAEEYRERWNISISYRKSKLCH
jgi:hypothetical protein